MRKLRLKLFQPEEEYAYLTYSLKNDKKEESKVLLENYKALLQKTGYGRRRKLKEKKLGKARKLK